jgi:TolA-binding protein
MARATREYHHGRFADAATAYGEAAQHAERRVDRDEALYREAKSLARVGELQRAIDILEGLSRERPVSRRTGRALYDAARLRLRIGDESGAIANFKRVVIEYPDHGVASRAMHRVIEATSDPAALRAWLNHVYEVVGARDIGDDVLMQLAEMSRQDGDLEGTRAYFERVIAEHPYPHGERWDDALWRLADLDVEQGDPARAAAHLEQMLSVLESTTTPGSYTLPRFPASMLRLGILYRDDLHDHDRAAATFQRLYNELQFSTLRDDAMLEEAQMYLAAHDTDRACALLHRVADEFQEGRARRQAAELLGTACTP